MTVFQEKKHSNKTGTRPEMEITCRKTVHFCWNVFVFLKNGHSLSWNALFFTTFFTGIESGKKRRIFITIHFRPCSNCYHRYHISRAGSKSGSRTFFFGIGIEIGIPNVFFRDRDRDGFHFEQTGSGSGSRTIFFGIGTETGFCSTGQDRDRDQKSQSRRTLLSSPIGREN